MRALCGTMRNLPVRYSYVAEFHILYGLEQATAKCKCFFVVAEDAILQANLVNERLFTLFLMVSGM